MLWMLLGCEPLVVSVAFEAYVDSVEGYLLGVGIDDEGVTATGSFWYDANAGDQSGDDEHYGLYNRGDLGGFELEVQGVVVTGSNSPAIEVWDTISDHLYYLDGRDPPMLGSVAQPATGVLAVDGVDEAALTLRLSFLDKLGTALDGDGLPDPFSFDVDAAKGLQIDDGDNRVWLKFSEL